MAKPTKYESSIVLLDRIELLEKQVVSLMDICLKLSINDAQAAAVLVSLTSGENE